MSQVLFQTFAANEAMTGYTVHTGSNEKFSGGWDKIFRGKDAAKKQGAAKKPAGKKSAAQSAKKRTKKK